ncbi:MAG: helix-turn-helix transcriptional regulator [Magnetococcales bacterium]|nr:helix-turn-helix transcriptional regulator [Magnetococcales bacterium]
MSFTSIGDKIKAIRKQKGLTLEQLGDLANSSKSYIWALENKNPPRPSADKIQKIADVLGVTPAFLLDQELNASPKEEVLDQAFFRKFQKMDKNAKQAIRRMVDNWDDD